MPSMPHCYISELELDSLKSSIPRDILSERLYQVVEKLRSGAPEREPSQ